jgi:hypothetical protein
MHFNCYVKDVLISRSDCIEDLGVMLDSKLYFHCHVDFVYLFSGTKDIRAYSFYYL